MKLNAVYHLIIYCLNCIRRDQNSTYKTGVPNLLHKFTSQIYFTNLLHKFTSQIYFSLRPDFTISFYILSVHVKFDTYSMKVGSHVST